MPTLDPLEALPMPLKHVGVIQGDHEAVSKIARGQIPDRLHICFGWLRRQARAVYPVFQDCPIKLGLRRGDFWLRGQRFRERYVPAEYDSLGPRFRLFISNFVFEIPIDRFR